VACLSCPIRKCWNSKELHGKVGVFGSVLECGGNKEREDCVKGEFLISARHILLCIYPRNRPWRPIGL
jgi:hypothetical protein